MDTKERKAIFNSYLEGHIDDTELIDKLDITLPRPTLGQVIGTVVDNFAVTNDKDVSTQLRVKFDFTTCTDADITSWLCGNRRIVLQRPLRSLSTEEIKALDGTTINALDAGKKVKSRDEQIAGFYNAFVNAGIKETEALKLATAAVDNPLALSIAEEPTE